MGHERQGGGDQGSEARAAAIGAAVQRGAVLARRARLRACRARPPLVRRPHGLAPASTPLLCRAACSHAAHAVDCQVVELLTYALNNSKVQAWVAVGNGPPRLLCISLSGCGGSKLTRPLSGNGSPPQHARNPPPNNRAARARAAVGGRPGRRRQRHQDPAGGAGGGPRPANPAGGRCGAQPAGPVDLQALAAEVPRGGGADHLGPPVGWARLGCSNGACAAPAGRRCRTVGAREQASAGRRVSRVSCALPCSVLLCAGRRSLLTTA